MDTKGTGWVPDYPDVRDITLGNEVVNHLARQVQGTQVAGSIESQKVDIVSLIIKMANNDIFKDKDKVDKDKAEIENLSKNINKILSDELIFVTAKTSEELALFTSSKELKTKVRSVEVMILKNILKFLEYLDFSDVNKSKMDEFDYNYYDCETLKAVTEFQKKNGMKEDGIVGLETKARLLLEYLAKYLPSQKIGYISSNIPDKVFKGITKNLLPASEKYLKYLNDSKREAEQDSSKQAADWREVIYPIIQIIAQLISPLGVHTNLEKVIEKGISIFNNLFNKEKNSKTIRHDTLTLESKIEAMISAAINKAQSESLSNRTSIDDQTTTENKLVKESYQYFAKLTLEQIGNRLDKFVKENGKISKELGLAVDELREFLDKRNIKSGEEKSSDDINAAPPSSEEEKTRAMLDARLRLNKVYVEIETSSTELETQFIDESENQAIKIPILRSTWEEKKAAVKPSQPEPESQESQPKPKSQESQSKLKSQEKYLIYLSLPEFVDLSLGCSPIENQGSLNSCTAHAGVALIEYFVKKRFNKPLNASRLFLYKVTRNLMHVEGNVGTSIRETMKAMALFGVPPEEYCPYEEDKVNQEPSPFCYGFAQNYQTLKYFRLDYAGISKYGLLAQIKAILVAGFPCAFGFTLYGSVYDDSNPRGHIPFPHKDDKSEGGHCVVAVGYDDCKVIKNVEGYKSVGALLLRNSWGTNWGEGGYGWLPYDYVLRGLTADWWSLLQAEWFDTGAFGVGANDWTSNIGGNKGPF